MATPAAAVKVSSASQRVKFLISAAGQPGKEGRKEGRKGGRKEGRVHLLSPIYKRASLAGRTGPEWAIVREEGDDDDDDDWC